MESSKDEYLPREIKLLVIHCSATRCNVRFSVEQLRECHLQRGFLDIGYHFYITRDGVLHHCRPISEMGAHVRGFNRHSIGICYEGGLNEDGKPADTRTAAQRFALIDLLTILRHQYPDIISLVPRFIKHVLALIRERNIQSYKKTAGDSESAASRSHCDE